MDIRALIHSAVQLAHTAAAILPGAGLVAEGGDIAEKIFGIFDNLNAHADPSQQAEMQEARRKLAEAVTAHAKSTSDKLRG